MTTRNLFTASIAAVLLSFGCENYEDDFLSAQEEIEVLKSQIELLTTQVNDDEAHIADLNTQLTGAHETIDGLNEQLAEVVASLETTNQDLIDAQALVSDLETQIENAESNIADLESQIAALKDTISNNNSNNTDLAQEIADLEDEIDALEEEISELEGDVEEAEEVVEEVIEEVVEETPADEEAEEEADDVESEDEDVEEVVEATPEDTDWIFTWSGTEHEIIASSDVYDIILDDITKDTDDFSITFTRVNEGVTETVTVNYTVVSKSYDAVIESEMAGVPASYYTNNDDDNVDSVSYVRYQLDGTSSNEDALSGGKETITYVFTVETDNEPAVSCDATDYAIKSANALSIEINGTFEKDDFKVETYSYSKTNSDCSTSTIEYQATYTTTTVESSEADWEQDVNGDGDLLDNVAWTQHVLLITGDLVDGTFTHVYEDWYSLAVPADGNVDPISCTYESSTDVETGDWDDTITYSVGSHSRSRTVTTTVSYTKSDESCDDKADEITVTTDTQNYTVTQNTATANTTEADLDEDINGDGDKLDGVTYDVVYAQVSGDVVETDVVLDTSNYTVSEDNDPVSVTHFINYKLGNLAMVSTHANSSSHTVNAPLGWTIRVDARPVVADNVGDYTVQWQIKKGDNDWVNWKSATTNTNNNVSWEASQSHIDDYDGNMHFRYIVTVDGQTFTSYVRKFKVID